MESKSNFPNVKDGFALHYNLTLDGRIVRIQFHASICPLRKWILII